MGSDATVEFFFVFFVFFPFSINISSTSNLQDKAFNLKVLRSVTKRLASRPTENMADNKVRPTSPPPSSPHRRSVHQTFLGPYEVPHSHPENTSTSKLRDRYSRPMNGSATDSLKMVPEHTTHPNDEPGLSTVNQSNPAPSHRTTGKQPDLSSHDHEISLPSRGHNSLQDGTISPSTLQKRRDSTLHPRDTVAEGGRVTRQVKFSDGDKGDVSFDMLDHCSYITGTLVPAGHANSL